MGKRDAWVDGVDYYRMSTDDQTKSIPEQMDLMVPRAKDKKVNVVQTFKDEGISGAATKKRDAFHAMVQFCQRRHAEGNPVKCVVVYDTSRFSRADSHETGHYIYLLREAGVNLVLTYERWYDLRKKEDRVLFNLMQDVSNHEYLQTLATASQRGKRKGLELGWALGGPAPFGFDRILVDESGKEVGRFGRSESVIIRKKGWHVEFAPIPADDPDPVRRLERDATFSIFDWFTNQLWSRMAIVEELRGQGVPPPLNRRKSGAGNDWCVGNVRLLLENPVYAGYMAYGRHRCGKFARIVHSGDLVILSQRDDENDDVTADAAILRRMPRGGYVNDDLFERTQKRIAETEGTRDFSNRGYPLASGGIIRCARCGSPFQGQTLKKKRVDGTACPLNSRYICTGYLTDKKGGKKCVGYSVREKVLMPLITNAILNEYLTSDRLEEMRTRIAKKLRGRQSRQPGQLERLREEVKVLTAEVQTLTRQYMKLDPTDNEIAVQMARELMNEQASLLKTKQARLRQLEKTENLTPDDLDAQVDAAVDSLVKMRSDLAKAATRRQLDTLLRQVVKQVTLHYETETDAKGRNKHRLVRVALVVSPKTIVGRLADRELAIQPGVEQGECLSRQSGVTTPDGMEETLEISMAC